MGSSRAGGNRGEVQQRYDGRALAVLMAVTGMNQTALAKKSKLTQEQISRIVRGENKLDRAAIRILSDALEAPPNVFSAAAGFVEFFDRAHAFAVESKRRLGRWPWTPPDRLDEVAEPTPEQLEWQRFERDNRLSEELGRNIQELLQRLLDRG